jgi:hypothetical protein
VIDLNFSNERDLLLLIVVATDLRSPSQ